MNTLDTTLPPQTDAEVALRVTDVVVEYRGSNWRGARHPVRAVSGISLEVHKGCCVGIVGESGSGKSSLAKAIAGLIRPTAGTVCVEGFDVHDTSRSRRLAARRRLQMVFQDSASSLNPRLTIATSIEEPLIVRHAYGRDQRRQLVDCALQRVGLEARMRGRYPHELSGGQRQRAGIARALVAEPAVLICDEPVSALDVSVQGQILNLLREIQQERRLTCILISHNLPVVDHLCEQVAVMQSGRIAEYGPVAQVFRDPQHPYTKTLLAAVCKPPVCPGL